MRGTPRRARAGLPALVAAASLVAGCGGPAAPPPLGNVLLYVDTDAPVPRLAGQLRVDLFTSDGTWFASRDVDASSPSQWPVSFGLFLPDGVTAGQVVVRLRAYPTGKVRDYRGYRWQPRPTDRSAADLLHDPPAAPGPTLVVGGVAQTPLTEPLPYVSIDRLLLVPLAAGQVGAVQVTLAGACFGTMADMRDFSALATCTDTEGTLDPLAPATVAADTPPPGPSQQGAFEAAYAQPCSGAARPPSALLDDDVCVQGGAFVLGSRDDAAGDETDDLPERVALLPSFYLDRYEVTVGRVRAAQSSGFTPNGIYANEGPIDPSGGDETNVMCTFTHSGARDAYPTNCATWKGARAFCRAQGGDLPTEAQWEYAASMSGRTFKTSFAWGQGSESAPACTDVVYGRSTSIGFAAVCSTAGLGPAPVTVGDHPGGDVTPTLGLVGFGGSLSEWTVDTFAPMASACWVGAPLLSPSCNDPAVAAHAARGGAWASGSDQLVVDTRYDEDGTYTEVGFRCVRPGSGP